MNEAGQAAQPGYWFLFAWVLAEQIGLPIPAIPALLLAGALVGSGRMHVTGAMALTLLAALGANVIWYQIGLHRGTGVIRTVCRISMEPDSCP